MSKPKNSFQRYPDQENSQLGPQKLKNNPKIKSITNIRIEETIENKNLQIHE